MATEYVDKKSIENNNSEKYYEPKEKDDDDSELVREYYTSNGKVVRNGVHGTVYPFNNGSSNTSKLFSVMDATGRCDSSGIRLKIGRRTGKVNKTPNLIYYDSPQQYMAHKKVKIQESVIKAWEEKRNKLMAGKDSEDDELNTDQEDQEELKL